MSNVSYGQFFDENPKLAKNMNILSGTQAKNKLEHSIKTTKAVMPKLKKKGLAKAGQDEIKQQTGIINHLDPKQAYTDEQVEGVSVTGKNLQHLNYDSLQANAKALAPHNQGLKDLLNGTYSSKQSVGKKHSNNISQASLNSASQIKKGEQFQAKSWDNDMKQFTRDADNGRVKVLNSAQIYRRAEYARRHDVHEELNHSLSKDKTKDLNANINNMKTLEAKCTRTPFMYRVANVWNKPNSIYNETHHVGMARSSTYAYNMRKAIKDNHINPKETSRSPLHIALSHRFAHQLQGVDNIVAYKQAQKRLARFDTMIAGHDYPNEKRARFANRLYDSRRGVALLHKDANTVKQGFSDAQRAKYHNFAKMYQQNPDLINTGDTHVDSKSLNEWVEGTKYKFNKMFNKINGKFKPYAKDAIKMAKTFGRKTFRATIADAKDFKAAIKNPSTTLKATKHYAHKSNVFVKNALKDMNIDPHSFGFKDNASHKENKALKAMHTKNLKRNTYVPQKKQHVSQHRHVGMTR